VLEKVFPPTRTIPWVLIIPAIPKIIAIAGVITDLRPEEITKLGINI